MLKSGFQSINLYILFFFCFDVLLLISALALCLFAHLAIITMCFSINFGLFGDWLAEQMFHWTFYKLDDCLVELVIYYLFFAFGGTFSVKKKDFVDPVENIDFQTSLKLSIAISCVSKLSNCFFNIKTSISIELWYTGWVGKQGFLKEKGCTFFFIFHKITVIISFLTLRLILRALFCKKLIFRFKNKKICI